MLKLTTALLATCLATTAVQAKEPKSPPASTATTEAPAPKAQRYCVEETPTGTRLPRKTCLTREEWLDKGFDPLKPEGGSGLGRRVTSGARLVA